jgi:hypothetical protein
MKFDRRTLLKRLASIPLVGLLVKKVPPTLICHEEVVDVSAWNSLGEPVPGIHVFSLQSLPIPIANSDFMMSLRECAILRGIPLKYYEEHVKAKRVMKEVNALMSREESDNEEIES